MHLARYHQKFARLRRAEHLSDEGVPRASSNFHAKICGAQVATGCVRLVVCGAGRCRMAWHSPGRVATVHTPQRANM
eukprot:2446776-Prymnesium_polylepis.1